MTNAKTNNIVTKLRWHFQCKGREELLTVVLCHQIIQNHLVKLKQKLKQVYKFQKRSLLDLSIDNAVPLIVNNNRTKFDQWEVEGSLNERKYEYINMQDARCNHLKRSTLTHAPMQVSEVFQNSSLSISLNDSFTFIRRKNYGQPENLWCLNAKLGSKKFTTKRREI